MNVCSVLIYFLPRGSHANVASVATADGTDGDAVYGKY